MSDTQEPEESFLNALGAEVAYWRKRRGLSRKELGECVGLSDTTLGRIERGGASDVGAIWRIAEVLDIPLPTLIQRVEEAAELLQRDIEAAHFRRHELQALRHTLQEKASEQSDPSATSVALAALDPVEGLDQEPGAPDDNGPA